MSHGEADTEKPLRPYIWLKDAKIYNKKLNVVPPEWIVDHADIIALLFTAKDVDKDGIIEKFYEIYENVKHVNIPIEVINVPMDDNLSDMKQCFENQANWFTLRYNDTLVHVLKYMYGVTCIPHIMVVKTDGTVVSNQGVVDLEEYGKNAIITWMPTSASSHMRRNLIKEADMYGEKWRYLHKDKSLTFPYKYSEPPSARSKVVPSPKGTCECYYSA